MLKSTKRLRKVAFVVIISLLLLLPMSRGFASGIAVDATCTLAQAITAANTDAAVDGSSCIAGSGADTITLSADITLSEALPPITSAINIAGGNYAISGADAYRIFEVGAAGDLTIANLAITRGSADSGGAIAVNSGSVTITDSTLSNNSADQDGGAIAVNSGVMSITDSTLSNNSAGRDGGAVASSLSVAIISGSSISSNSASQNGGGVAVNSGVVIISGSSISSNSASEDGGGIYSSGNLDVENSTIFENSASRGGGLHAATASGIVSLTHLTVSGNSAAATAGGGLHVDLATVHLRNSIIYGSTVVSTSDAESTAANDCVGTLTQDVGNLIGSGDCSTTAITSDPRLGELTSSPPDHYPITDDSPAVDAADPEFCLVSDQIGTPRPQGDSCDIGAFEYAVRPLVQAQQADDAQADDAQADATEEPEYGYGNPKWKAEQPTPTPEPWMPPTCQTLPSSIIVVGISNSTQCNQLDDGGVGIQSIVDAGYIDAVDVWSDVQAGTQVCFRQSGGSFLFLDAATIPRAVSELSLSYTISDGISEMICTQIDRPGSVILMPES